MARFASCLLFMALGSAALEAKIKVKLSEMQELGLNNKAGYPHERIAVLASAHPISSVLGQPRLSVKLNNYDLTRSFYGRNTKELILVMRLKYTDVKHENRVRFFCYNKAPVSQVYEFTPKTGSVDVAGEKLLYELEDNSSDKKITFRAKHLEKIANVDFLDEAGQPLPFNPRVSFHEPDTFTVLISNKDFEKIKEMRVHYYPGKLVEAEFDLSDSFVVVPIVGVDTPEEPKKLKKPKKLRPFQGKATLRAQMIGSSTCMPTPYKMTLYRVQSKEPVRILDLMYDTAIATSGTGLNHMYASKGSDLYFEHFAYRGEVDQEVAVKCVYTPSLKKKVKLPVISAVGQIEEGDLSGEYSLETQSGSQIPKSFTLTLKEPRYLLDIEFLDPAGNIVNYEQFDYREESKGIYKWSFGSRAKAAISAITFIYYPPPYREVKLRLDPPSQWGKSRKGKE